MHTINIDDIPRKLRKRSGRIRDFYNASGEQERYTDTLNNVRTWTPLRANLGCRQIAKQIDYINNEISKLDAELASGACKGGCERTKRRYIKAWSEHLADHKNMYSKLACVQKKEEAETDSWINKTEEALTRQEGAVGGMANLQKYMIYGLGVVAVGVGAYFILK